MIILPQEIEVWYVLPAIRKELTWCLIKDFGYTYEKAGNALGISKAAVSQYINNKRASKIKLPQKALNEIMKSCKRISEKKEDSVQELIRILELIKKKKLTCEVCEKHESGVLKGCKEVVTYKIIRY